MRRNTVTRAVVTAAVGVAGLTAFAGTATAATSPVDSREGSTDPADYNTDGTESAQQPQGLYFDHGPVFSATDQVYGFVGDPVDGVLRGNLPVPGGDHDPRDAAAGGDSDSGA